MVTKKTSKKSIKQDKIQEKISELYKQIEDMQKQIDQENLDKVMNLLNDRGKKAWDFIKKDCNYRELYLKKSTIKEYNLDKNTDKEYYLHVMGFGAGSFYTKEEVQKALADYYLRGQTTKTIKIHHVDSGKEVEIEVAFKIK